MTISAEARDCLQVAMQHADDEGLLHRAPLGECSSEGYRELVSEGILLPYEGGRPRKRYAWIVHYPIPQAPRPSNLPPPSIQNNEVWLAYLIRDNYLCHLCGYPVAGAPSSCPDTPRTKGTPRLNPSLDHVLPRCKGGSDYPSNIRVSHKTCNIARRERRPGESPSQHAPVARGRAS